MRGQQGPSCHHVRVDPTRGSFCPVPSRAADAFVTTTHGEGFGRPPLEAMAMGLPTIATNWSGLTAFVADGVALPIPVHRFDDTVDDEVGSTFDRGPLLSPLGPYIFSHCTTTVPFVAQGYHQSMGASGGERRSNAAPTRVSGQMAVACVSAPALRPGVVSTASCSPSPHPPRLGLFRKGCHEAPGPACARARRAAFR